MTLPSERVSLNGPGFEDQIHPRGRRGGGNVGIAAAISKVWGKGEKQSHRFPPFPQAVICTPSSGCRSTQAAIPVLTRFQFCSNWIGLT